MKILPILNQILSEDFKSQTLKFISQGFDKEIVKTYIDDFKHIRDKKYKEMFDTDLKISAPVEQRNNIDAYKDFRELEQLVDYVAGKRPVSSNIDSSGNIEVTGEAIYKNENYEVYYADTPRACIKYKGKIPYSWCVARSDSSNMFYTYRFKPYEPAFYFVKNIKLTEKELGVWNMAKNVFNGKFKYPYHFFVIQVPKNATMDDISTNQYIVTSANNDGDTQMSWEEIMKVSPNINEIREVLQPKPFTPEEREKMERFKNGISDEQFAKLRYEDKRSYLDIYPTIGKPITTKQFMALPNDLMNLYVSFGIGLNDEQFAFIKDKKDILKRYTQISERKLEEYLKSDRNQRLRLKMSYTELITLSDDKIKAYLESLSDKEINQFIKNYGADKFDLLEKHLTDKFTEDYKSIKNLVVNANRGDLASMNKLSEMVPENVDIFFHGNMIIFDVSNYGPNYLGERLNNDLTDLFETLGYTGWGGGYDDSYFDEEDYLEDTYLSTLQLFIESNPDFRDKFKQHGLSFDIDTVIDLLDSYNKKDNIVEKLEIEYSDARDRSENKAFLKIRDEITSIIFIDDNTNVEIGIEAFVMYLTKYGLLPDEELSDDGQVINNKKSGERYAATSQHKSFFTTDNKQFIDNIVDILENILYDYDVPQDYNSLYEEVNEAGWNFNDSALDTASINRTIERAIEGSLDLLGDDDGSSMGDEDTAKLKTQVIQTFNKILKSLGQDPTSSVIENEIVTMEFDRSRFQMDYKVYTKMTNKETNKKEEGYMNIKDIPTYFTNYKLFEQLRLMKKLIKR
jgi:hypothetical protein